MIKQKIFLSGGFHSNWQNSLISKYNDKFIFLNPREHGLMKPTDYTFWDIHFVRRCDILFAYMESSNPSGYGLAFEIGLAIENKKTVILIDEKSLTDPDFKKYFEIVRQSSTYLFNSMEDATKLLETFILI